MLKKHLTIQKSGYIEPSITEIEVKVEAGFAESIPFTSSLEDITEEAADDEF